MDKSDMSFWNYSYTPPPEKNTEHLVIEKLHKDKCRMKLNGGTYFGPTTFNES